MEPATLVGIAIDLQKISRFITNGGLKESICMVSGDIHFDAALVALEASNISSEPRQRVLSVITHLEAAHASYTGLIKSASKNKLKFWLSIKDVLIAEDKDRFTCVLMALCYASLGDRRAARFSLSIIYEPKMGNWMDMIIGFPLLMTIGSYHDFVGPLTGTGHKELMPDKALAAIRASMIGACTIHD